MKKFSQPGTHRVGLNCSVISRPTYLSVAVPVEAADEHLLPRLGDEDLLEEVCPGVAPIQVPFEVAGAAVQLRGESLGVDGQLVLEEGVFIAIVNEMWSK